MAAITELNVNFSHFGTEVPYKTRITSDFSCNDPKFWEEGDEIVFNIPKSKIKIRAGIDDETNASMIYIQKGYAEAKAKTVQLEKRFIPDFLDWLGKAFDEFSVVGYPNPLPSLEALGSAGLIQLNAKGQYLPQFMTVEGDVMFKRGNFRARWAFDIERNINSLFLNQMIPNSQYSSWPGPIFQVNMGDSVKIGDLLKKLDTLF